MSVSPLDKRPLEQMEISEFVDSPTVLHIREPEDYYDIGHHIKSHYGEVFIEPRHYETTYIGKYLAPIIKKIASLLFENVQAVVYYGLSFLIGIILSFVWGLLFAINSLMIVWFMQPVIKFFFSWLRIISILLRASVRVSLDPVFQSCGNVLSLIAGTFNLNIRGLSKKAAIDTI